MQKRPFEDMGLAHCGGLGPTNSALPTVQYKRTSDQKNVLYMPPMPNENMAQKLMVYPFAKYSDGGN